MLFKSIPGNQDAKERLINQVDHGRISHAQLFYGSEGSAALALALAYAQYVLCKHKVNGDACGVCASCNKMQKLIHPDVHFVFPTNTTKSVKKAPHSDAFLSPWREALLSQVYQTEIQWYEFIGVENGQGNIPTLDAEKLISKLSYKAYEGDYKIAIIWIAERMNVESANKLLKLLEEPPEGTLFILVSYDPGKLLRTIRSRVQEMTIPYEAALPENAEMVHLMQQAHRWIALCIKRNPQDTIDLVALVEEVASGSREAIKYFLKLLLQRVRELLVAAELGNDIEDVGSVSSGNIEEIYNEINLSYAQISQNGSAKIVLLDMALRLRTMLVK